jgi:hypothetical protein
MSSRGAEVAQPGRRSDVDVERLQITLAKADVVQLDRTVRIGKFGRNRNEVAARIISDWLHDKSPEELHSFLARLDSGEEFDKRVPASEKEAT